MLPCAHDNIIVGAIYFDHSAIGTRVDLLESVKVIM